jgi:Golgi SNAP receptor complex protein 1
MASACNLQEVHYITLSLQRFTEILQEFWRTFNQIKSGRQRQRETQALHARATSDGSRAGSALDNLLRERSSLQHSHKAADEVLSSAALTHEALVRQRVALGSSSGALSRIQDFLPGVQSLMGLIGQRRQRNDRIVALLIGCLLCFILWWKLL